MFICLYVYIINIMYEFMINYINLCNIFVKIREICRKKQIARVPGLFVFFRNPGGASKIVFYKKRPKNTRPKTGPKIRGEKFPNFPKHSHRKIHLLKCTHLCIFGVFSPPRRKSNIPTDFLTYILRDINVITNIVHIMYECLL